MLLAAAGTDIDRARELHILDQQKFRVAHGEV